MPSSARKRLICEKQARPYESNVRPYRRSGDFLSVRLSERERGAGIWK